VNTETHPTPSLIAPALEPDWLDQCPPPGQPLQLGVLASGSGSNFEAILRAIAQGKLNAQVRALVYNNPGAGVAHRADNWGIPKLLCNHRDFADRETCDRHIGEILRHHGAEWVIMAGWMRIVTPVLIDAFPDHILNIHPSLLPSFPGIHAVEQALNAGVQVTGCTVHRVIPAVDAGPILMQAAVPVLPGDTADTLHARIQIEEHRVLPQAIALAAIRTEAVGKEIKV